MKKKFLSFILVVSICMSNLSGFHYVNAEESVPETTTESSADVERGTIDETTESKEETEEITDVVMEDSEVSEEEWVFEKIVFDKKSPQETLEEIEISAQVQNANEGLQYKFVWQKDNWKEWGVLKDFSNEEVTMWTPSKVGNYTICVDVKDINGKTVTLAQTYSILKANWRYENMSPTDSRLKCGEQITFSANTSGNTRGLRYKFVWQKDNWKEWGVITDFSEENEAAFMPETVGEYTIIVDIKDLDGKVTTKSNVYKVMTNVWTYEGIETNVPSPQEKYSEPIEFKAVTSGENSGLQYKFVWQKDNWKKWGIIKETSAESSVKWMPKEEGVYTILVDVKDLDGETITKSLQYEITKVKWNFDEIEISPKEVQKKEMPMEIKAVTSGNTEKLQYKYVWMKDNWKEWGIIKAYSEDNLAVWTTPSKTGAYKILVDVKDRDGEVRTKEKDYFVATQIWEPGEININDGVEEQVYTRIPISVNATGEIEELQYKFVWQKDNWKEWGVIKDFDTLNNTTDWIPKKAGKYTVYADIKDVDGRVKTVRKEYNVLSADWKLDKLDILGSTDRFVGDTLKVTAVTSGNTEGLQYKFVCRRGSDWSDWEVIRGFSSDNSIEIPLNKDKDYHIYVDIKNQRGITCDPETVTVRAHKYLSAGASSTSTTVGKTISIYPNLSGTKGTPRVKYVWMKNNWKEWGVLKEFSSATSINMTPTVAGTYYIYVDVEMNGIVQSKSVKVVVSAQKNGWYYEGGYKFYYKNGVKQLDLDGILPKQSSYYIKVNRKMNTVTVYAKDGNNGYIIPVKRFACSVGLPSTPTPTGTFYTSNKYRWHTLMGPSYGQYCTRIVRGILFHSVAGRNMTSYNLNYRDYNKLGQAASHGCVRLTVRDAKWIYDNCPTKTRVTIYDSSVSGPLGKPATIKIPAGQTWDPTDPNI